MYGYTKLFQSIVTSTIWQEPNDCRVLWITMLALKGADHVCSATIPALAKMCDLTIDQTEQYLKKFQEPDPYSRSTEFDGRRIEKVDGGYYILNGPKFQNMLRHIERRDYIREKVKEYRARARVKTGVNTVNQVNPSTTDTTTDKDIKNTLSGEPDFLFENFWKDYQPRNGTRGSKKQASAQWGKMTPAEHINAKIALDAQKGHFKRCKEKNVFVAEFPDCWRWLRDKRFTDEIVETPRITPTVPLTQEVMKGRLPDDWDKRYEERYGK
jgi:hypothetical protein